MLLHHKISKSFQWPAGTENTPFPCKGVLKTEHMLQKVIYTSLSVVHEALLPHTQRQASRSCTSLLPYPATANQVFHSRSYHCSITEVLKHRIFSGAWIRAERTVGDRMWPNVRIMHKNTVIREQLLCIYVSYNFPNCEEVFTFRCSSTLCVPIHATAYRLRNLATIKNSHLYCKFTEIHHTLI